MGRPNKHRTPDKLRTSSILKDDRTESVKCNNKIGYYPAGSNQQTDIEISVALAKSIHQEFSDAFSGILCFKSPFS